MLFFVEWVCVADGVPPFLHCGGCEWWLPPSVLPDISPSRGGDRHEAPTQFSVYVQDFCFVSV